MTGERAVRGLLLLGLVIGLAAACGTTEADDDPRAQRATELTIIFLQAPDAPERRLELACDPPRGSHPQTDDACALVRRLDAEAFAPIPGNAVCTQIYGGPEIAHVRGTVEGIEVNANFSRTNGCEIERWDRLRPLLPAAAA
jgi:hypothetical protein